MANTDNRLIITELSPDGIKTNLINYLKNQDKFKDYNFEGSGFNILLDILAYNTHYSAYYTNMEANERFMDTALLEDSVKSKAKELGYLPRSRSGAVANVDITVTTQNTYPGLSYTLPRYTMFSSSAVDGTNFMFCVKTAATAVRESRYLPFVYEGVELTQGRAFTYSFSDFTQTSNPQSRFVLPDVGIDTSTLSVRVQHSSANLATEIYNQSSDITVLDGNSAAFFLETGKSGKYVLQFGDGVTGKKLANGNIVVVNYIVTDGELANGAEVFSYYKNGGFPSGTTVVVTTNNVASGGASEPDIETIRFNALRGYSVQNRAVTSIDYETVLKQDYPFADSIAVWGGEDNDPPQYGSVFISLKPKSGYVLSTLEKDRIVKQYLKSRNVLTILPNIIDPNYLYVKCNLKVNYDARKTMLSANELKSAIRNSVFAYNAGSLGNFNSSFRLSSLFASITATDPSILGCDMSVTVEKREVIDLGVSRSYTIPFGVELARGGLTNRVYSPTIFYTYDGLNILRTCYLEESPLSSTGISNIEIRHPGSSYTSQASVVIEGDAASDSEATAHPVVVNGKIQSIVIDTMGAGYSYANVSIVDTKGYGASGYPVLAALKGELRSFYYQNGEKIILNRNVGTIRYDTGEITLTNFFPVSTSSQTTQEFRFIAQSLNDTILPKRNNIIVIDPTDSTSVTIELVSE